MLSVVNAVIYLGKGGIGISCFSNILQHIKKRKKVVLNYTSMNAQQHPFQEQFFKLKSSTVICFNHKKQYHNNFYIHLHLPTPCLIGTDCTHWMCKRADLLHSAHQMTALIPSRLYSQYLDSAYLQFRQKFSLNNSEGLPTLTLETVRGETHPLSDMLFLVVLVRCS